MGERLSELRNIADLDAALARSASEPIILYKHSLTCGTSGVAYEELMEVDVPEGTAFIIPVQTSREVSREIESRLAVRHESPQVLLVAHGRVVWHASHFRVTARAIAAALRQHATEAHSER